MANDPSESARNRLATYGSLAPGQPNHHHLSDLNGRWIRGEVRGRLVESGWGAAIGFPSLVLDDAADPVTVQIFESEELAQHWQRLDEFEGKEYRRVTVKAKAVEGEVWAYIYVLAPE